MKPRNYLNKNLGKTSLDTKPINRILPSVLSSLLLLVLAFALLAPSSTYSDEAQNSRGITQELKAHLLASFVSVKVSPAESPEVQPNGDFYLAKTEVTQTLFTQVTGYNPSYYRCGECPVNNVSGHNIQAFIKSLNTQTGYEFYLPTKLEWDYAAKGGMFSKGYQYSGSNTLGDVAWYVGNADGQVHPVAQKLPNELGLYDMTGNVSELCSDPMEGVNGLTTLTALRGGSFDYAEKESLLIYNDGISMNLRLPDVGFRLAIKRLGQ